MTTSVSVPEGFSELLEEFAVTVLREKPADLIQFAAQYFNNLHMSRKPGGSVTLQAVSEQASTAEVEMAPAGELLLITEISPLLHFSFLLFL